MRSLRTIVRMALVSSSCVMALSCASVSSGSLSQEQENTKLVQQAYQNFRTGNIQGLLQMFSPTVEWQLPNMENVPVAGSRRGREQVAQFFTRLGEAQEVLEFEPREFIAQGDKVIALGHYKWRVKSTGRNFQGDWAHVFTIRDGQITRFQEYLDTAAVVAAYRP